MLKTRVIPVLLWDDRGLCKPVQFDRPGRFVGSLMSAAMLYEGRTCDELILLDIDATPNKRGPRFEEIEQFTSKLFCPLTIGGGVRSIEDIRDLLSSGADKVVLRSHASPNLIRGAARKFGAQCIVVAIDYRSANADMAIARAIGLERDGAGEIILTNMDRDGMPDRYDVETIKAVCTAVKIPVIANGGCSSPADMLAAIRAGAHAVAASSMFLYTDVTPASCKDFLASAGVPVRIEA